MRRYPANLSNYQLTTGTMGKLIPINVTEVLPNDSIAINNTAMVRLLPMAAPVYHGMTVRIHSWFVPNRVVWDGWEEFITCGEDGLDLNNEGQVPQVTFNVREAGDLLDHMGVPPVADKPLNALPLLAYFKIYDEFYRDQDLEAEVFPQVQSVIDGSGVFPAALPCAYIAWGKDYFTTARPWPFKGEEVTIPVADQVVKLHDIRLASAVQRFQEKRARYGSRYPEFIRTEFGITPPNSALDLPEYLGGGRTRVAVSEVLQTAPETGSGTPVTEYGVGDLYGHGVGSLRTRPARRRFAEHGYIITLLSVRPDAIYANAVARHWLRNGPLEWFQKDAQYLGQEPIQNDEVYYGGGNGTFGYQDRYREYREQLSQVSGDFRTTLNYWHMARDFSQLPALNASFVACNPTDRIFVVQDVDNLWMYVQNRITARRVVPPMQAARLL